ncbi:hypothetical protein BDP27DRAFT_1321698 [Rhodocollybia butyracea]|uniref:BRCT domain-containing protein n=1 Tax=Rhodocollybia butyracea TaxID=206335 RepID=A0A9P5PYC9_9AGAR|nr:hypothetical protein BDP27DRAFT_1321698 [Rhodocollybia butyracea]
MAPTRNSVELHRSVTEPPSSTNNDDFPALFIDLILGTPLAMYVDKDVQDRDVLVDLIAKHGGTVSQGYSGVTYILVDPLKTSGQNLYRQYASKKGKIILNSRWVHECIKERQLQTFHTNWAGCKVTGNETASPTPAEILSQTSQTPAIPHHQAPVTAVVPDSPQRNRQTVQVEEARQIAPPTPIHSQILHPPIHVDTLPQRTLQTPPPQSWQGTGIAPHQTHMAPAAPILHRSSYRDDTWDGYEHSAHTADSIPQTSYDYRFREPSPWGSTTHHYYDPTPVHYEQPYDQNDYVQDPGPDPPEPAEEQQQSDLSEKARGRKRSRASATPVSALVPNRNPPARSPTPPTRTVKSTYGGNLFTVEDVLYLKKYIDYCQDQGLVLSLREICERIAVKTSASFYSWRRYCNKHQIRLGGYAMNAERPGTPSVQSDADDEEVTMQAGPGPGTIAAAQRRFQSEDAQFNRSRNRSPTPPKALYRSTTGKGVAFTDEDVTFLVRFMEYRKSQGNLDMVVFWKDVAAKAPHHSRASWMKFWRRHKHELNRREGDDPLPLPPDKKMRYSREDDVLLAKFFYSKPDGTSDKVFQAFARTHPHHPWKGWQEHHRIHKVKIDHFIERLKNGENIDVDDDSPE